MIELHDMLVIAGFFAWFLIGWMIGRSELREKYEARILELMRQVDDLSERLRKGMGKWLLIDYFIGEDGPVEVYECNICGFEITDDSYYCPDCGFRMDGTEETPEGIRRREMAESEEGIEVEVVD